MKRNVVWKEKEKKKCKLPPRVPMESDGKYTNKIGGCFF